MKMQILPALLGCILLVAAITDLRCHKVFNWLTLPGMVLGLGLNCILNSGWSGLGFSLAGLLAGGLIFFPFFFFGGMGAGDIKLMAVIGAFMGWIFVVNAAVYIALSGGVWAILYLSLRRELWLTLKSIGRFFRAWIVPHLQKEPLQQTHALPYAVVIAIGSVAAFFLPPFFLF